MTTRNFSSFTVALFLFAALSAGLGAQETGPDGTDRTASTAIRRETPWHLPDWPYRQVVVLPVREAPGGINTGRIEVEAPADRVAPNGADLRLVDAAGNAVPCHPVDETGRRIEGDLPVGKPIVLHFEVGDEADGRYCLYYGNPGATDDWADWSKRVGALTLMTCDHPKRRAPANHRQFVEFLEASRKVHGSGVRSQINDPANPFADNERENEHFISIYEGAIYCPVDGVYEFATDSDDASFLHVDGTLVAWWEGGHNPAGAFVRTGNRTGEIQLKKGIYRIRYEHVQSSGGTLARAGWRPPGAHELTLIPPEAFVRALPTETVMMEERDSPLSVYFDAQVLDVFRFGNDGPFVARALLTDRSESADSEIALREWHLEDGRTLEGERVDVSFIGDPTPSVTLRCLDAAGNRNEWSRRLRVREDVVRRVDVAMELDVEEDLLLPGKPVRFSVRAHNGSEAPLEMELAVRVQRPDGAVAATWADPVALSSDSWETLSYQVAALDGERFDTGRITVALRYGDHDVLKRVLAVRSSASADLALEMRAGRLMDERGERAVLRLSEAPYDGQAKKPADVLADKGPLRILVLDDALYGAARLSYIELLELALAAAFPQREMTVRRHGVAEDANAANPVGCLVDVADALEKHEADLIILAGSLRDVIRFESLDRFETRLRALLDRIESLSGAPVVLIAPPPVIGNPGFGQSYAIAVKRIGLRKKVPVADAWSAFLNAAGGGVEQGRWHRFYRDAESAVPVYHLAPTAEGQRVLCEVLWRTLFPKRPMPAVEPTDTKSDDPAE